MILIIRRERSLDLPTLLYQMENNGTIAQKFRKQEKIILCIMYSVFTIFALGTESLVFIEHVYLENYFCNGVNRYDNDRGI